MSDLNNEDEKNENIVDLDEIYPGMKEKDTSSLEGLDKDYPSMASLPPDRE